MKRFSGNWISLLAVPVLVILVGSAVFAEEDYEDLTPEEAYNFLVQNEKAVIVDVRSQAEYAFVGHPPRAYNLPMMFWDSGSYSFKPNPNFKKELGATFATDIPVIFICLGGGRSAKAAEAAVSLGFTEVYNVVEGFEGEEDSEGHRSVNGWKNSNLPYSYDVGDKMKYQPVK